jgi:hypothetical protein
MTARFLSIRQDVKTEWPIYIQLLDGDIGRLVRFDYDTIMLVLGTAVYNGETMYRILYDGHAYLTVTRDLCVI